MCKEFTKASASLSFSAFTKKIENAVFYPNKDIIIFPLNSGASLSSQFNLAQRVPISLVTLYSACVSPQPHKPPSYHLFRLTRLLSHLCLKMISNKYSPPTLHVKQFTKASVSSFQPLQKKIEITVIWVRKILLHLVFSPVPLPPSSMSAV